MSLQPQEPYTIPEETVRVARTIFPSGNLVTRIADALRRIVGDRDFVDLFPMRGRPAGLLW